jgi:type IV pilus assembly protein PilF
MLKNSRVAVAAILAGLLCAGCVTTETGGFTEKKDPQKAIEHSVHAARNYIQQRNWEAAKRHLKIALELDDRNADVHEAMAQVFWNTGEYEQAEQHFRRAVTLNGTSSRTRNNYAAFLFQQKRYKDAEVQLESVADDMLYDRRGNALVSLGRVRLKLKKYAEAKDALERAHLMDRDNTVAVLELAEALYQLGEYPKAQSYYDAYRKQTKGQSPGSLWLGIRLAEKFGDQNAKASYALALKNLYPRSEEYLEYMSAYGHGGQQQ